jgi:hypothetical protein
MKSLLMKSQKRLPKSSLKNFEKNSQQSLQTKKLLKKGLKKIVWVAELKMSGCYLN